MKTKFGAIIVDGSGKIGGHVASKNRSGSYLRTKVTPINPQSVDQSAIRNRMSTLSAAWGALTEVQREQWNGAVGNYMKSNIFGDKVKPSGINLFIRLNANIMIVGGTMIDTPPVNVSVSEITGLAVTCTNSSGAVSLTETGTLANDEFLVVKATPTINAGRSFVKNEFRNIAYLPDSTTFPKAIKTEYEAKFGSVGAVGQAIWFKCFIINSVTGQMGLPVVVKSVIV